MACIIEEANNLSEHISEDAILYHFSWVTTSYQKKKRLFTWARKASEKEWSGSTSIGKACVSWSHFYLLIYNADSTLWELEGNSPHLGIWWSP